ncbi:MAG TPA: MBL fold metallo-hydrolase [bacterium]|jgi:glyoxylase-like metal-dependent hydrolase (beta-lactamase superfamily II)
MLKVLVKVVGDYQMNTIIVWDDVSKEAVWFDPGEGSEIMIDEIEGRGLTLKNIINTHGHLDHIAENALAKAHFEVPLLIHKADRRMLTSAAENLSILTDHEVISPDADGTLDEGDTVKIGDEVMQIFHVPGHTPGSLVFYHPGFLIAGDTIFRGSIGRTDFPRSSERDLLDNLRTKVLTLPDDTIIYSGHGPATTVGEERRTNPFLS